MFVPLMVLLSPISCIGLQLLTESTDAACGQPIARVAAATADKTERHQPTGRVPRAHRPASRIFPDRIQDQVDASIADDRARLLREICARVEHVMQAVLPRKNACLEGAALPKIVHSRVLAICIAARPTPPAADKISTLDLRRRWPRKQHHVVCSEVTRPEMQHQSRSSCAPAFFKACELGTVTSSL